MTASGAMGIMSAALVFFMLVTLLPQPLRVFCMLALRACLGTAAIFVLDILLSPVGLCVGINPVTAGISAVLGIPGVAMLYGLAYIFI